MLGLVFAYGSLRPGGEAYRRLLVGAVRAVTPGVLENHALYGRGLPYPFVRPEPGATVVGEIVELVTGRIAPTLEALDRYEGDEYRRVVCPVTPADGGRLEAWVYRAAETVALEPRHRIDTGDWRHPGRR